MNAPNMEPMAKFTSALFRRDSIVYMSEGSKCGSFDRLGWRKGKGWYWGYIVWFWGDLFDIEYCYYYYYCV